MAAIIAITNQKGGVGKTTTAVNLAACLSALKQRVLLVDLDPQGNATMGCGVDKHTVAATSYEVLLGEATLTDALQWVEKAELQLLPANGDLTAAEVNLLETENAPGRLRAALASVEWNFDIIMIDCPPSLNMLTVNALTAAQSVIIPVQCEYYALEGLSALLDTIEKVRKSTNPGLRIEGLVRTMFDPRNRLANDVSAQIVAHFGATVFETLIPRNVRLAEAPSYGLPIIHYDDSSRGAQSYRELARELRKRLRRPTARAGDGASA
ncbi:MAG: ParA family protein [Candidatus Competibacter sp.]|nr:ParA family protein [Candidatus Competibacter sp.]MDG4606942.1 AAA family ATPase [Candidatus Contendobacter sp.]HRD49437.1 AAA family ATPase [Candidatus Contendobacter sp.]